MKKLTALLFIVTLLASAAFADEDLKQKIESQNTKFAEFTSQKDFKSAAEIYTTDGQLLQPNGEIVTGKKGIAKFWKATFGSGINEIKTIVSEVEGKGKMLCEIGRYQVYLPNGRRWKIYRHLEKS